MKRVNRQSYQSQDDCSITFRLNQNRSIRGHRNTRSPAAWSNNTTSIKSAYSEHIIGVGACDVDRKQQPVGDTQSGMVQNYKMELLNFDQSKKENKNPYGPRITQLCRLFIAKAKRNCSSFVNTSAFQRIEGENLPQTTQQIKSEIFQKIFQSLLAIFKIILFIFWTVHFALGSELLGSCSIFWISVIGFCFFITNIGRMISRTEEKCPSLKLQHGEWNTFTLGVGGALFCILAIILLHFQQEQTLSLLGVFAIFLVKQISQILVVSLSKAMKKIGRLNSTSTYLLLKVLVINSISVYFNATVLCRLVEDSPDMNWFTIKNGTVTNPDTSLPIFLFSLYEALSAILTLGFSFPSPVLQIQIGVFIILRVSILLVAFWSGSYCAHYLFKRTTQAEYAELIYWNKMLEELQTIKMGSNIITKFQGKLFGKQKIIDELKSQSIELTCNTLLYQNYSSFSCFSSATCKNLAEKVTQQYIKKGTVLGQFHQTYDILMLKEGSVAAISPLKRKYVETNCISNYFQQKAKLLCHSFINRNNRRYRLKAIGDLIVYKIAYKDWISVVKQRQEQYEKMMEKRDSHQVNPNEYELFPCRYCPSKHSEFDCPQLHFIPFASQVIHRHIQTLKKAINQQKKGYQEQRIAIMRSSALKYYCDNKQLIKQIRNQKSIFLFKSKSKSMSVPIQNENIEEHSESSYCLQQVVQKVLFTVQKVNERQDWKDEIWQLKSDKLHDFNNYFPQNNPESLLLQC